MEDSPRSAKRRKLDTPTRNPSSALRKPSARLASRQSLAVDIDEADADNDAATPSRRSSRKPVYTAKSTLNKRPHKNGVDEEKDVYDDIEGALPESTRAPRIQSPAPPQTNTPRRRRKKIDLDPSLPHPFKSTPGRSAKNDTGTEGASPTSFRALVNEYRHGVDAGDQDELAVEGATPTKQTKNTRATKETADKSPVKGHLTSGRKPLGRPPRRSAVHEDEAGPTDELHKEGLEGDTPSRRRSGRKPARSAKETKQTVEEINDGDQQGEKEVPSAVTPSRSSTRRALVPDSEDALSNRGLPDATTSKRGRRRANRADHTNNRDDVNGTDNEPEVNEEEVAEEVDEEDVEGLNFDGNSVTGSVLDPTEPSPFNKPPSASKKTDAITVLQGTLASGPELDLLKTILMERLTGKRPVPVVGLDEEYKTVHQLVEHTITAGEGNSMLLIGARGSGKTALVNKVLSEISKDNAEDYHVVRLNGFIHTDDKIALREIWRQLGKEMDIEEDGGLGKNYADTLTTLLALLSHPSEHTGELTDQVAKAVIFVMDEFDLFAMHPRQTLLYNLFDIAQSRKAPIAVLGLTTRIDVANSLEKRVKSRFSHRYVHLSLAKSFTAYQELCKASLVIQPENLNVEERSILCSAPRNPTTTPAKSKKTSKATSQDVLTTWNSNISSLFASKTFLTTHLAPHYYQTKSVPAALTSLLLPIATLDPAFTSLSPTNTHHLSLTTPDSKLNLIPALSSLALSLLIAACRLDVIHDADTCNFNMAYDEYVSLASKARIQSAAGLGGGGATSGAVSKVWGKEVARREWEGLVELELLMPVVAGQVGGFGMVRCDVSLEEVGVVVAGGAFEKALERWCRQL